MRGDCHEKPEQQMNPRFFRWMSGRNGIDTISITSLSAGAILCIITAFTKNPILYLVSVAFFLYAIFRILSGNVQKRRYENQQFRLFFISTGSFIKNFGWKTRAFFTEFGRKIRYGWRQKKDPYRIFLCPGCGQKVRVPSGKGKISIHCPKCGRDFIKKT
jgi:predicted RNA-binding Zn-ribbon protein involved in translation (DUF1610 family)